MVIINAPGRTVAIGLIALLYGLGLIAGRTGAGAAAGRESEGPAARPPNVVVIITDDQGHGDLGFHGNPRIRTPHLDQLARESVRLDRFQVMPVCAPTRACLMTGRYNYRTRVVDTYRGRAMMDPQEVTLAEMLSAAGYRTAIFGKWHLGDNYPLRPIDQGFQEALVLKGGGIGQPSDPPGGSSYFDPVLQHNGRQVKVPGYCSDVFTDAAIAFIAENANANANRTRPFFVYLAFNCPHTPLEVPEAYLRPYQEMHLANDQFPALGHPLPTPLDPEVTARVYGMVTNIDDNVGRLLARLDDSGLARDTIVVFLTDNGPQQVRYNSGMLDRKTSVHQGGIRVPCFIRWPAALPADRVVDRIAAAIDLAPTLLDACGVPRPEGVTFDGKSLLPLLKSDVPDWPDRTLFAQWHRGDVPERYRAFAASTQRYKLVRPEQAQQSRLPFEKTFELYDLQADPLEQHNLADENPDVVARLRSAYDRWYDDVSSTRGYDPPRITLGTPQENPTVLTRQDWRGSRASWAPDGIGHWETTVARPGSYTVTLHLAPRPNPATAHLAIHGVSLTRPVEANATECTFESVALSPGPGRLEAWLARDETTFGVLSVDVKRID
jgi:arylsulfatase A-like enzyme